MHLRRVGYYKTVAKRSEAQGDGIYTLETNLGSPPLASIYVK